MEARCRCCRARCGVRPLVTRARSGLLRSGTLRGGAGVLEEMRSAGSARSGWIRHDAGGGRFGGTASVRLRALSPLHSMLQARIGQPVDTRAAWHRPRFRAFIQGASGVRLFGHPVDRSLETLASRSVELLDTQT